MDENLHAITDPITRSQRAAELIHAHRASMSWYGHIRAQAILEAASTMTQEALAQRLGVTQPAVAKLLRAARHRNASRDVV